MHLNLHSKEALSLKWRTYPGCIRRRFQIQTKDVPKPSCIRRRILLKTKDLIQVAWGPCSTEVCMQARRRWVPKRRLACRNLCLNEDLALQGVHVASRSWPSITSMQASYLSNQKDFPAWGTCGNKNWFLKQAGRQQKTQKKPATRSHMPRWKRHASSHFEQSKEAKS